MKNDKPTQEELKKFWEWCGLYERQQADLISYVYDSNGVFLGFSYPKLTPDSLLEYAVLKLDAYTVTKQIGEAEHKASVMLNGISSRIVYNANPAIALFRAMQEVIENEGHTV